jgi:hypothetical protein
MICRVTIFNLFEEKTVITKNKAPKLCQCFNIFRRLANVALEQLSHNVQSLRTCLNQ